MGILYTKSMTRLRKEYKKLTSKKRGTVIIQIPEHLSLNIVGIIDHHDD
jgi:hypothetical protein